MDRFVESNGCRIAYVLDGPTSAPALLLSNSLGTTREFWDGQVEAFSARFRVIRYDTRGHGVSSAPAGDYTIDQLAGDGLAILDAEKISSAHVCGLSLGGLTAMWLGVHAPARVSSLVLANTSARIGSLESWSDRISLVRREGMPAVAERAATIWFSKEFRDAHPETIHRYQTTVRSLSPDGYVGCCAALRDADLRNAIAAIEAPTLAVGGTADIATPVEALEFVRDRIPGARLLTLPAAHFSNIEDAAGFTAGVLDFLLGSGLESLLL
jgi:3-oxoadipate enol-lactonase